MQHTILAPAKINLTLNINSKREDGYHNLSSLVCFGVISDKIKLNESSELKITSFGKFGQSVTGMNIIEKCVQLLHNHGITKNFDFEIEKNIPVGAGLGGGSSDAANFLKFISNKYNISFDLQEIIKIGADVPVCMYGQSCIMSGTGEFIKSITLPKFFILLINPAVHNNTQQYFSLLNPSDYITVESADNFSYKELIQYINKYGNTFLKYAVRNSEEINHLIKALKDLKADAYGMTGTGSSCFLIANSSAEIQQYYLHLKKLFPYYFIQFDEI